MKTNRQNLNMEWKMWKTQVRNVMRWYRCSGFPSLLPVSNLLNYHQLFSRDFAHPTNPCRNINTEDYQEQQSYTNVIFQNL